MSDIIKRTVKGGSFFFASNTTSSVLGFLFILLSSRILGPVEFGIFSLGLSVSTIVTNIGAFGLPITIQRFLSGEGDGERTHYLYGAVILIVIVISLLLSVTLFISARYISVTIFNEEALTNILKIFSVGITFDLALRISKAIIQSQEHVREFLFSTIWRSVFKIVFLVLAILWIRNAIAPAMAMQLAALVAFFYTLHCIREMGLKISLPEKEDVKKILCYSTPLVFVGFGYLIAQQTDRIMLGWLSTSADVGAYTVSSTLAYIMTTLHSSLVAIFLPLASKAYRNRNMDELKKTYLFISKWVSSVNGILALLFAGFGMVLLNFFGTDFANDSNYQILLILTILYFIGTWVGPTGALLQMSDGHKIDMYNTGIYILLNIVFNYVFILNYGLIGAAWGTLLAGIVKSVLQGVEIKYLHKLNVVNSINLILFFIVMGGISLSLFIPSYSMYISLLFIGLLVFFIAKNITPHEKEMIRSSIQKYV